MVRAISGQYIRLQYQDEEEDEKEAGAGEDKGRGRRKKGKGTWKMQDLGDHKQVRRCLESGGESARWSIVSLLDLPSDLMLKLEYIDYRKHVFPRGRGGPYMEQKQTVQSVYIEEQRRVHRANTTPKNSHL